MSRRGLLIATFFALLLPGAVLARWLQHSDTAAVFPDVLALPTEVGPWRATQQRRLEDDVLAMIEPTAHLLQLYEAPGRTPIWLYIGVYAGRAGYGKGAHDPEVCYPAQGWEILDSRSLDVELRDSGTLHVKHLDAHRGAQEESVLYWFQPAKRWPASGAGEQALRVLDAVSGSPQYAFVRLSGPSDGGPDARRDLLEFAARIASPIRIVVDNEQAPPDRV
jgi:EpsI family protein